MITNKILTIYFCRFNYLVHLALFYFGLLKLFSLIPHPANLKSLPWICNNENSFSYLFEI